MYIQESESFASVKLNYFNFCRCRDIDNLLLVY
jgi:hypothetical protein